MNEEKETIPLRRDKTNENSTAGFSDSGSRTESLVKEYESLAESDPGSNPAESSFAPSKTARAGAGLSAAPKEKMKVFFIKNKQRMAGALLVVALAAGATMLREPGEKPEASLLNNVVTPENPNNLIIRSSLQKMGGVKAFGYQGKVDVVSEGRDTDSAFVFTHGGTMQFGGATPEFYTSFDFDSNIAGTGARKSNGNIEAVYLDKTFYAKVNEYDGEGQRAGDGEDIRDYLRSLKGSWYSVPEDTMESVLRQFPEGQAYAKALYPGGHFSGLGGLLTGYDLFEFEKDLGDDKVGETETYHYQVKLDSAEAFDLALELLRKVMEAQGEAEAKSFAEELDAKAEEIRKREDLLDFVLSEVDTEIWIGKNDNLIYRLKAESTFNSRFLSSYAKKKAALEEKSEEETEEAAGEESLRFSLDYAFSDFDTATVRKPENARDLDKALVVLEYQGTKEKTKNDPDKDGDGLSDKLEVLYGSAANKADTDRDGYSDGDEVWNGYDPLAAGSARLDYAKIYDSLVESLR